MSARNLDPVTGTVVANAFASICEEMGHTMLRTANSSVFVEGRDFSCAIVDPEAELVASANFDPSHLSAMALTVEYLMLHVGHGGLRPGDVWLVNDPYRGGGHLPDIALIRPVFADGALLAFAVNRAHHIDISGMAVAGFPGTARSIFQEGLRIPPVRWYAAGEENPDVIDIITLNMRFPRDQIGDFRAQFASTHTAETRLLKLTGKYGAGVVRASMDEAKDHSEVLMRGIIAELPDGTYEFDEVIEDDGPSDTPYRIHVSVSVTGDEIAIDFDGTSPQAVGPINSSYGNTLSSAFNAVLQPAGPEIAFNQGCFRPVHVSAPRGSLLNPVPPAPCFGGVTEVTIRIIDAVLGALAPVAGERIGAASYGTCINFSGGGHDAERGEDFGFYFFLEGGWGACAWRDGWNCTPNPTSNFNDYPVEWVETTLPLRYEELRLNTDSGGAGHTRGGVGTVRRVTLLADDVEINGLGERAKVPSYGIDGGYPGATNQLSIRRAGAEGWQTIPENFGAASPTKFHGLMAQRGDSFLIASGGGGGCGDPLSRTLEDVAADVEEGLVGIEAAADLYGAVLEQSPDGRVAIDRTASEAKRAKLATAPREPVERYRALMAETLERAASGKPAPAVAAELRRIENLIERGRATLGQGDGTAGRLDHPLLNEKAMVSWDSEALRRWLARRGALDEG